MKNPTFSKAFFISFNANSGREVSKINGSYYLEKDSYIAFQKHTISFASKHPRKLVPSAEVVPMCRIKFAFDGREGNFEKQELNIDPYKTNTQIAEEILKEFLKDITPHSVIYICAHGKPPNRIAQHILMPNNEIEKCYLKIDFLANLMSKYIPTASQNNLKIHLLVCNGSTICFNLMKALNNKGFRKTSVLGYRGVLKIVSLNSSIYDFSTKDRHIDSHNFKHGKYLLDNKMVTHNYVGELKTENYRYFKQKYLLPSLEKKEKNKEKDKEKKEQLILLLNKLQTSVTNYIEYKEQGNRGCFHLSHKYGKSYRNKANHFLNTLEKIS